MDDVSDGECHSVSSAWLRRCRRSRILCLGVEFSIDQHGSKAKGILTVNSNDYQTLWLLCATILKSEAVGLRKDGTDECSYGNPIVSDLTLLAEVFSL